MLTNAPRVHHHFRGCLLQVEAVITAPVIAGIALSRTMRAQLERSVWGTARVVECSSVRDLRSTLGTESVLAVVLPPRDVSGLATDSAIGTLRAQFPLIPIVLWLSRGTHTSADVASAIGAGAHGVVIDGIDDVGVVLRGALAQASRECTAQFVLSRIDSELTADGRLIVGHCLRHGHESLSVVNLAAALGLHRRTLLRRLAGASLPGPREIIRWCRVLHVTRALSGSPVFDRVAREFDFASPSALRNMLRRHTGLRPRQLQAIGFDRILEGFRLALRADRPPTP